MSKKPAPHAHGGYVVEARIDGVRRSFYGPTHAAACQKRDEAKRRAGIGIAGGEISVGAWLDLWLERKRVGPPALAHNTYRRYRALIEGHLAPALGTVALDRLQRRDVAAMIRAMGAAGKSATLINDARSVLTGALNEAVREEMIERNVALLVRPVAEAHPEAVPLSHAEARRFLDAIADDRLCALWHLVLAIGLRQGEALGLTWSRVDLGAGRVRIDQQLQRERGAWVLKGLKGGARARVIDLPPDTHQILMRHRSQQNGERAGWGKNYGEMDLVFCHPDGRPYHGTTVRVLFHEAATRARVPLAKMHHTRHTCATLLLAQGLSVYEVSRILGHSSSRVTERVYSHMLDSMRAKGATAMQEALYGADE